MSHSVGGEHPRHGVDHERVRPGRAVADLALEHALAQPPAELARSCCCERLERRAVMGARLPRVLVGLVVVRPAHARERTHDGRRASAPRRPRARTRPAPGTSVWLARYGAGQERRPWPHRRGPAAAHTAIAAASRARPRPRRAAPPRAAPRAVAHGRRSQRGAPPRPSRRPAISMPAEHVARVVRADHEDRVRDAEHAERTGADRVGPQRDRRDEHDAERERGRRGDVAARPERRAGPTAGRAGRSVSSFSSWVLTEAPSRIAPVAATIRRPRSHAAAASTISTATAYGAGSKQCVTSSRPRAGSGRVPRPRKPTNTRSSARSVAPIAERRDEDHDQAGGAAAAASNALTARQLIRPG